MKRLVVALLLAGVLIAFWRWRGARIGGEPAPGTGASASDSDTSAPAPLAEDERIAFLLAPCTQGGPFLEDTSDLVPVLVSKLATGQLDPLRQAKAELAELGDEAVPELRRLFDARFLDPGSVPVLFNVLEVLAHGGSEAGRDLFHRGLEHPIESVRNAAVRAIASHPVPEDYDRVAALLPIASGDAEAEIGKALLACDRPRLERDFVVWFPARLHPRLLVTVAPLLSAGSSPETVARFCELYPLTEGTLRIDLETACAAGGEPAANAELERWLREGDVTRRAMVVRALSRAGKHEEAARALREDPDESLRLLAAQLLAAAEPDPENTARLAAGASDPSRRVRLTVLEALVARGLAAADDEVIEMLKGRREDLEEAVRILSRSWRTRPELAARAFEVLARLERGELGPLEVDERALYRAIAQVPLSEAARRLHELARATPGTIDGIPAHRWFVLQAGNTGPSGQAWLRDRWREESDPTRRVDLVVACAYDRSDVTRDFLVEVVESERVTPLEVLHAADLLAHRGPASRVAPLLKRITLGITDAPVRIALHCLLWRWYGVAG